MCVFGKPENGTTDWVAGQDSGLVAEPRLRKPTKHLASLCVAVAGLVYPSLSTLIRHTCPSIFQEKGKKVPSLLGGRSRTGGHQRGMESSLLGYCI